MQVCEHQREYHLVLLPPFFTWCLPWEGCRQSRGLQCVDRENGYTPRRTPPCILPALFGVMRPPLEGVPVMSGIPASSHIHPYFEASCNAMSAADKHVTVLTLGSLRAPTCHPKKVALSPLYARSIRILWKHGWRVKLFMTLSALHPREVMAYFGRSRFQNKMLSTLLSAGTYIAMELGPRFRILQCW